MDLSRADTDSCAVLRVSGPVGSFDGSQLSSALAKAMADGPTCVVCDLSAVTWLDPVCVAVWVAAQWSAPWPGPVIWLAGARGQPAEALRATGAARYLALADSAEGAMAQQLREPPVRRERLALAPAPTAPGRARRFAADVLARWRVPDLTDEVTLIVSELVTNGLEHADSDIELRLECRQGLLHIAVRDRGSPDPRPRSTDAAGGATSDTTDAIQERGRGLQIVQALAAASGQTAAPAGGRIYWATLRTGERTGPLRSA
ncbi:MULTISPECIES: ATP-binding protein [unclassified Nocardioides]|uniref:ATP-binding protein n=1 Tax=unclassified Nocardioides TaxID=2615069 RepID=UPI00360F597A